MDSCKASQQVKGVSNAETRCSGLAACQKHVQGSALHAERRIAQMKDWRIAQMKDSIRLAVKNGHKQKAEQLLQEICYAGHVPNVCIFNFVISACGRKGDVACAEKWLNKMLSMGLTPNMTSYNMILDACVKADSVKMAERWFVRLLDDGQTPDEVSYATMIYA